MLTALLKGELIVHFPRNVLNTRPNFELMRVFIVTPVAKCAHLGEENPDLLEDGNGGDFVTRCGSQDLASSQVRQKIEKFPSVQNDRVRSS